MAMDLKCIDQSTKDIVFGFTRKAQLLLQRNNMYFTIPPLIIHCCLLFYHQREYLTTNDKEYIQINNDASIADTICADTMEKYEWNIEFQKNIW